MTLSPKRLEELAEMARKASPGKWVFHSGTCESPGAYAFKDGVPIPLPNTFEDAEYMVAASPQTLLALLDMVKEMREALENIIESDAGRATYTRGPIIARKCLASVDAGEK